MQQWAGPTARVVWQAGARWAALDLDTDQQWAGEGRMRHVSPDGAYLFLQTGENIHVQAEDEGRSLAPEDVAARIIDYHTGAGQVRISVADVLAVHPEADVVRQQHMCFKQTEFSPNGRHISFVFSNAWYARHRQTEPQRHELFMADRDGSNIRPLGPFVTHPSWHPNGEVYTAVARDAAGMNRFMQYPIDGSPMRPIEPDWPGTGHPSYQPGEGRYLAVDVYHKANERGHVFLRLFDLQHTTYEDVLLAEYTDYTNASGTHLHPAWSADGRRLYFASAHGEAAGVFCMDLA